MYLDIVQTSEEQADLHEIHHKVIIFLDPDLDILLNNLLLIVGNLEHHMFLNVLSMKTHWLDQILKSKILDRTLIKASSWFFTYSRVPNTSVGRNKSVGRKICRKLINM